MKRACRCMINGYLAKLSRMFFRTVRYDLAGAAPQTTEIFSMWSDRVVSFKFPLLGTVLTIATLTAAADGPVQNGRSQPATATSYVCPGSIRVTEKWADRIEGWTDGRTDSANKLTRLTVYSGPPSEMASLVPDETIGVLNGRRRTVWKLVASGRPYWMECAYSGTRVVLQREVGPQMKSCWIESDPAVVLNGRPMITAIACE